MSFDPASLLRAIGGKGVQGGLPANGDSIVFNAVQNQWIFQAGAGVDTPDLNYFRRTGDRVYSAPVAIQGALVGVAMVANNLKAHPFPVPRTLTLDLIEAEVTALAVGNVRLGIYNDLNVYPNNLLFDSGDLSTGALGIVSVNPAIQLQRGLAWLVTNYSATPSMRAPANATPCPILGAPTALGATNIGLGWSLAQAYGALPNPFPAGGAAITGTIANYSNVFVRVASYP